MLEPILVFRSASNASDAAPAAKNEIRIATAGRIGLNHASARLMPAMSLTSPMPKPANRLSINAIAKVTIAIKTATINRPTSSPRSTAIP